MTVYEKMNPGHIDGLVKVEEDCFASGYARNTFEKELENKLAYYVVALVDGEVAGYAGLWNMCGSADIMNVGVLKSFRRHGIAEGMLGRLEEYCIAQGIFEINLEVRVGNVPARQLYAKMGYDEIAVRKGYYDGKEDGIVMKKLLTENRGV
ncbi:MAG: ribosomal protein S18-alanine N-acetyltransferase [Clostridia bacterium]|nr:ribosomal protein S18-alanine N-acetyltransferase [Clostridia bacterium]